MGEWGIRIIFLKISQLCAINNRADRGWTPPTGPNHPPTLEEVRHMTDYQFNPNVEQWKAIPNFPGYEVSDHGRIRSYRRQFSALGFKGIQTKIESRPQKILGLLLDKVSKRLSVILCRNKKTYRRSVHRLVLLSFVGVCPIGMEACHYDGKRINNCLDNLRWDTHANNVKDQRRHDTILNGERHYNAKLSEKDVLQIRELNANGMLQSEIARHYGVHKSNIRHIILRTTWKHI